MVIQEGNGASITYTTQSSARFNCSDAHTPVLTYPNAIPTGGAGNLMRSWWKSFCLYMSGSFTQIDNIKVYTDGTLGWTVGTSGLIQVGVRDAGDNGCPIASYEQAAGSSSTGYDIDDGSNGHDYYKDQTAPPADLFDYTDGAELELDTDAYTSEDRSKLLVCQLVVDGDSTLGAQSAETITFEYDEI